MLRLTTNSCDKIKSEMDAIDLAGQKRSDQLVQLDKQIANNQIAMNQLGPKCNLPNSPECQQARMQLSMIQTQTTLVAGEKIKLRDLNVSELKKMQALQANYSAKCIRKTASK